MSLALFTFAGLTGCKEQNVDYRDYFEIKGNVKQVKSWKTLSRDGDKLSNVEIWTFNEDGQLLRRELFAFRGTQSQRKPIESVIYSYQDGLLRFEETLDSVGNLESKYEFYKFDNKGLPLEYKLIDGIGDVTRIVNSFTTDSRESLSFENDLLIDRHTTMYDNKKNVVAEKLEWLYAPDTTVTYNWTINNLMFDNQGNWIKRTVKEIENSSSWTEEREISYH